MTVKPCSLAEVTYLEARLFDVFGILLPIILLAVLLCWYLSSGEE